METLQQKKEVVDQSVEDDDDVPTLDKKIYCIIAPETTTTNCGHLFPRISRDGEKPRTKNSGKFRVHLSIGAVSLEDRSKFDTHK